jgi:hypothetical protein
MLEKPAAQEARRGDHHWADPDNDDQLDEINVIFRVAYPLSQRLMERSLREISVCLSTSSQEEE